MSKLQQVIKNLKAIDIVKIAEEAILEDKRAIIQANKAQLYEDGIDSLGRSLGRYSPMTIEYKKAAGQPYDRVTLKDTGDFYAGFDLASKEFPFSIESSDIKTEKLKKRFGKNIFGLTNESQTMVFKESTKPLILSKSAKAIKDAFRVLQ